MILSVKGISLIGILLAILYSSATANPDPSKEVSDNIIRIEMLLDMTRNNIDTDTSASIQYLKNAVRLSREIDYTYGEALSYYLLGKVHGCGMTDLEAGIQYHNKSIILIEQSDSLDLLGKNFYARGKLYYRAGLAAAALNDFLVSAHYYKKNGDSLNLAVARVNIATIYATWSFDSYPRAIRDFEGALTMAREIKSDYLFAYTISYYAQALMHKGNYTKARTYLDQAIPKAEKDKNLAALRCRLYINMGDVLIHDNDLQQAKDYITRAQTQSPTNEFISCQGDVLFAWGRLCEAQKMYGDAEAYYKNALELYIRRKMRRSIIAVYEALVDRARSRNNFENAFDLKSRLMIYEDSIVKIQRNEMASQMQASIFSMERTQQLELGKKNEQIHQLYIDSFMIALASLLLVALLHFNKKRLRESKDKAMLTQEKLILQKELENIRIREEQLKQTLEFNAKTLTANTLNLIQKNEILEKIKAKAEEVRKASTDDLSSRINSLVQTANFALNIDKDWENFRIYFEQVHNNFFENLKIRYPDLNSNDLRLCALLKLNLDTKEIATIMDISPESVKVARSRLRKKLQLETSDNLSSFITQV